MINTNDFHSVQPAALTSRFVPGDTLIEAAWERNALSMPGYPSSVTVQGPWKGHDGQGGMWIGMIEHAGLPPFSLGGS